MYKIRIMTHYATGTHNAPQDHWYGVTESALGYDPTAPTMVYPSRHAAMSQLLKWYNGEVRLALSHGQVSPDTYKVYRADGTQC